MSNKNVLSDPELRRYERQMALPEIGREGQQKLKDTKLAVVGIGGIGSFVLQYLAAIGVGYIGIIDFNLVDEKNIQRQTLYGGSDLGKLKSIAGKDRVQTMYPFNNYEIINLQLTEKNVVRSLQPFQMVVDATNDIYSGIVITEACSALRIPVIRGTVENFKGTVAVLENDLLQKYVEYLRIKLMKEGEPKGASAIPYGLVGSFLAMETQKLILDIPEKSSCFLEVDMMTCNVRKFSMDDFFHQEL